MNTAKRYANLRARRTRNLAMLMERAGKTLFELRLRATTLLESWHLIHCSLLRSKGNGAMKKTNANDRNAMGNKEDQNAFVTWLSKRTCHLIFLATIFQTRGAKHSKHSNSWLFAQEKRVLGRSFKLANSIETSSCLCMGFRRSPCMQKTTKEGRSNGTTITKPSSRPSNQQSFIRARW